ncbi:hypothetical protein HOY81_15370 [Streptomyces sp. JJ36]|nr:hypothetical protein [Streptomyces sp. JJ36]
MPGPPAAGGFGPPAPAYAPDDPAGEPGPQSGRGRFRVAAAAATGTPPGATRGRQVSCTLVLSVAGALVAVLLAATVVFDLLPGGERGDTARPPASDGPTASGAPSAEPTSEDSEGSTGGADGGDDEPAVPEDFLGTWKGSLTTDSGLPAGTMELTIEQGAEGEKVASGTVTLLSLVCPAEWTLTSATGSKLVMDTSVTRQTPGCTGGTDEWFTLREDGTLRYEARDEAGGNPTGTLRKIG